MSLTPLKGGLDLANFPPPPGTLAECLNFEVGLKDGYQKIAGFQEIDCDFPGEALGQIWFQDKLWLVAEELEVPYVVGPIEVGAVEDGLPFTIFLPAPTHTFAEGDWFVSYLKGAYGEATRDFSGIFKVVKASPVSGQTGSMVVYGQGVIEPGLSDFRVLHGLRIRDGDPLPAPGAVISNVASLQEAQVVAVIDNLVLVVYDDSSFFDAGDSFFDASGNESQIVSVESAAVEDLPQALATGKTSLGAAIYTCSGDTSARITMGHQVRFNEGVVKPRTLYEGAEGEGVESSESQACNTLLFGTDGRPWSGDDGVTPLLAAASGLIAADDGSYIKSTRPADTASAPSSLFLRSFGYDLRPDNPILGVEVKIVAEWTGTALSGPRISARLIAGASSSFRKAFNVSSNTDFVKDTKTTVTLGSSRDLWAFGSDPLLSATSISTAGFGVDLSFQQTTTVGTQETRIHQVEVTVHYQEGSSVLYFRSGGSDVATGRLVHLDVEDGIYDVAGDPKALGTYVLQMDDDWQSVPSGAEINTLPGGAGGIVGFTDGLISENRIALSDDAQIQLVASNFFASPELAAVYGVSGAGLPFTFTDDYFTFIYTGIKNALPRHISRLKDRLVIGYDNGNADLSTPALPLDFKVDAATLGVGEKITGLLPLQGDVLAVFTANQIIGFYGAANADFQERAISPNSGAIEYTVADMGIPVFCDNRGIATLQTSERFGDFAWGRMSYAVHPWLIPRIQSAGGDGIAGYVLARAKSQYRLIFKDGYILTMTLKDQPEFTIQRYTYEGEPLVFASATSGIDSRDNSDRVFLSGNNRVFELDKGLTFAGATIPCFIETQHWPSSQNVRANALHIHGQTETGMTGEVTVGIDDQPASGSPIPFRMDANERHVQTRATVVGRTVAIRIANETDSAFLLQGLSWPDISRRRLQR